MKNYEVSILNQQFPVTCEPESIWTCVAQLMARELPPSGTIPTIREIPDPTQTAVVSEAPSTAITLVSRAAPIVAVTTPSLIVAQSLSRDGATVTRTVGALPMEYGDTYTINPADEARALADEATARKAGWAIERPLYRTGRPVIKLGRDNANASRLAWESQADAVEALINTRDIVRREERRDVLVKGADLRMTDRGFLRVPGVGDLQIPARVWQPFTARVGIPYGAGYLAACSPELRAINFNRWVTGQGHGSTETFVPGDFKLRLRKGKCGDLEIYAAVGEKYASLDTDRVCELLARGLPADGRAEVHYDGFRMKTEVTWHSDVRPENYVVGEYFKTGMRFACDDTGGGSITGLATLLRNLCLNLIILHSAELSILDRSHRGNVDRMIREIRDGIEAGREATGPFIEQWSKARRPDQSLRAIVVDAENPRADLSHVSIGDLAWGAFLAASKRDLIPVGLKAVPALFSAWSVEGLNDPTRAGLANGLTRFAHTRQSDPWAADDIEKAAGRLLASSKPIPWIDPHAKTR
jgi:hypothetical protein